ncbi:oxidoreductase [Phytomonospora sp. NPDC050363]|uniref:oxidoreductase n=1 Tax=Phytomonospora sp. NPDC050363 TaxID=3155642 RepID=UPI0033DAEAEE
MTTLSPLTDLPDVAGALESARARVDKALWNRTLRKHGATVATEVSLVDAVASAALEGASYDIEEVRGGAVTDPVVQGALRVAAALPELVTVWEKAPRQALARLHLLAARGLATGDELGRPVRGGERFSMLCDLALTDRESPAILLAAVVEAELLSLRVFDTGNGLVARAAAKLTLAVRGLDPRGLIAVDAGHAAREPEYLGSSNAFATGTSDGVRSWLRHYAAAVEEGCEVMETVCARVIG